MVLKRLAWVQLVRSALSTLTLASSITYPVTVFADVADGFAAYQAKDYSGAFREWLPLAEQGDVQAQRNIGLLHQNGLGVAQSHTLAAQWFRRAAKQGEAGAQFNLGLLCEQGSGVPQDQHEAFVWYSKAAAQGLTQAETKLGYLYQHGSGVPVDDA